MAGYLLHSLSNEVFQQLITSPTREQALVLADYMLGDVMPYSDEFEFFEEPEIWPEDRDALADRIIAHLAQPEWYTGLRIESARKWDLLVQSLRDEPGEALGIDFRYLDDEPISGDCIETKAKLGATMMTDLGSRGFRYYGKPAAEDWPTYSILLPEMLQTLLIQLEGIETKMESSAGGYGSPRQQYFDVLMPTVREVIAQGRALWVQTDV